MGLNLLERRFCEASNDKERSLAVIYLLFMKTGREFLLLRFLERSIIRVSACAALRAILAHFLFGFVVRGLCDCKYHLSSQDVFVDKRSVL